MRLTCPECSATYEVSPILLSGHRTVQCVRCGHRWTLPGVEPGQPVAPPAAEEPPAPGPLPLGPVPPGPPPPVREARPARPRGRRRTGLVVAWVLTILVLAAAAWAAVHFRTKVMQAWEPSTRAYSALGFRTEAAGAGKGRAGTARPGGVAPTSPRPSPPARGGEGVSGPSKG